MVYTLKKTQFYNYSKSKQTEAVILIDQVYIYAYEMY